MSRADCPYSLLAWLSPLRTACLCPPIPDRRFDFCATRDDYDGAEDARCPSGYGATSEDAIADLLQAEELRDTPWPDRLRLARAGS